MGDHDTLFNVAVSADLSNLVVDHLDNQILTAPRTP